MTIKEQKHQIVLMQCEILDSDLSEEERNGKLKPLFKEFARLKKQEVKKAPKPQPGNSCRLTDQETGRHSYGFEIYRPFYKRAIEEMLPIGDDHEHQMDIFECMTNS